MGGGTLQTLLIEAATSMMALSEGLRQLADPTQLSSLMCKILPHGTLEVVDNKSGRTITIRELDAAQLQARGAPVPQTPATAVASPTAVPPPDPGASRDPGAATAVGLPALGGDQSSPGKAPRKRRQTQELISSASGIAEGQPTPAPAQVSAPLASPPLASPPVAAPRVAAPPPVGPVTGPAPPPTAQVPIVDPLRSSGEVMGVATIPNRHITEPAIIIDDHLQAEIEQLENLRKAREAAMTPPTMRPIPHKVFKVLAEAPEAPRFETLRRRYVSVWPSPPRDALEEVLQIQIAQVRSELETVPGAKRVLVAAFDHAFEKIPLRPPLGLCSWNTVGSEEAVASFIYGDQAAALWNPAQPSTGSSKSAVMVPALDPGTTGLGRPSALAAEEIKTAVMPMVDAQGRPLTPTERTLPLPAPEAMRSAAPPPSAGPPPAAGPPPSAAPPPTAQATVVQPYAAPEYAQAPAGSNPPGYPTAPAPVQYPAELQGRIYDTGQLAPPPDPPTGTLDPFYPPAHGAPSAHAAPMTPPVVTEPTDLLSLAFQRFQPLFYVTDRQQAFAFAIDTALGLVPSQAGVLLLYDYEARDLYSAVIRAPGSGPIPGYRTAIGQGVAGFCATQGLPLALTHGDQDARFSTVLGTQCGLAVYTLAGVPIQYQGRLYGVLEMANRQAGGAYSTDELNALAYIGRQLAERLSTTLSTQMPAIREPGIEPPPT